MGSPSALRKLNDRAALYALLESGPLSRLDLERAISVSSPAAAQLLSRLEESGLIRHAGHRPGGPGPRARLWTINERASFAAGLDVNEWAIDAVIADLSGNPVGEARTVRRDDPDPIRVVRSLLGSAARKAGIRRSDVRQVVVGISGAVDPRTGILNHADHIREWTGFDVQERLSQALAVPVAVENDVKLVLGDESIRGRAVGCEDVLLLWMGSGIATATIQGGELQRGFHGSAGEVSFVPLGRDGLLAGHVLATRGVLELGAQHGIDAAEPDELFRRLRAVGGATAEDFMSTLAVRVVDLLLAPVAVVDPELVILAGDIGLAGGDELAECVRARLHEVLGHRPRVVAGTGYDNSVRQGALDAALRLLRESVFEDARNHQEVTA